MSVIGNFILRKNPEEKGSEFVQFPLQSGFAGSHVILFVFFSFMGKGRHMHPFGFEFSIFCVFE